MYLPKIYEKFSSKFPEVLKDYQQLGKTCRESGPLEKKYQDLANLGIAIGANSRGAVMSQTRKHSNPAPVKKKCPCCFIVTDDHRFSEHDSGHGMGG